MCFQGCGRVRVSSAAVWLYSRLLRDRCVFEGGTTRADTLVREQRLVAWGAHLSLAPKTVSVGCCDTSTLPVAILLRAAGSMRHVGASVVMKGAPPRSKREHTHICRSNHLFGGWRTFVGKREHTYVGKNTCLERASMHICSNALIRCACMKAYTCLCTNACAHMNRLVGVNVHAYAHAYVDAHIYVRVRTY